MEITQVSGELVHCFPVKVKLTICYNSKCLCHAYVGTSSSKTPPREGEKKKELQAPIKMTPSTLSTTVPYLLLLPHMHGHAVEQLAAAPSVFMAREAPEIPVVHSSSSISPTSGIPESHQIIQVHTPFPSWSPYAGTLLTADDPAAFYAEPSSSSSYTRLTSGHLWNQTTLSTGAHGSSTDCGGSNGYGRDFLSLLETRSVTPEMLKDFPTAACDYLKGMDGGDYSSMAGSAPYGLDSVSQFAGSSASPIRHNEIVSSSLVYMGNSTVVQGSIMDHMRCHDHELKRDGDQQQELGAPTNAFLQQMLPSSVAIHGSSLGYCGIGNERVYPEGGVMEASFDSRSSPDVFSFSGYKSNAELTRTNRHDQHIMLLQARTSSRSGSGAASEPKKRKSGEKLGGNGKKSKQDTSNTSPPKAQEPNVKLGEKIIALQKIVSPFGKTDRSSVLFETIKHIEYLHEQIQVHVQWGGETEEQKAGLENDLRGRGLCLVPVSCTPQVFRDNILPDCWTPAYKSSLYR